MDEPPRRTTAAWAAAGLPRGKLWLPAHGESRRLGLQNFAEQSRARLER
jgi:hypothetical protein